MAFFSFPVFCSAHLVKFEMVGQGPENVAAVAKEHPPFLTYLWALGNSSRDVSSTLSSFTTVLLKGEKNAQGRVQSMQTACRVPHGPRCPGELTLSPALPCVVPMAGNVLLLGLWAPLN